MTGERDDAPKDDGELSGEELLDGADPFATGEEQAVPSPDPEDPAAGRAAEPAPSESAGERDEPAAEPPERPAAASGPADSAAGDPDPATEEMFAAEALIPGDDDLPELDPAVRSALLESDHPADSAAAPPVESVSEAGPPEDESAADTARYALPDSTDWEVPSEAAIAAEETAARAEAARAEVREVVEQARRTGRAWDPPRPPVAGDFEEPTRRPRYWWRFLLATVIIVFAFGGATSASVLNVVSDIASKLEIPKKNRLPNWLVKDAGSGPQTIAILGSDERTGGGAPAGEKGRSDTTMLLRLDPDSGQIAMLSIPRDLKVNIPGHGTDKFNAAYSYGGTALTLKTIQKLTGLEVNHVINVDFQGFAMLVDAVGCVFVDVDRKYYHSNEGLPPSEQYAEIDIDAGYQKLCGADALEYARYRHTDTDLVRASRQQDLLGEVRNRLSFGEILKRRDELIEAFTDNATSDISSGDQILDLIRLLFDSRDARTVEVKFPSTFTMDGGVSYVEASKAQIDRAVDRFLGFKETAGPIGTLSEGDGGGKKARKRRRKSKARQAKRQLQKAVSGISRKGGDRLVDGSASGMELASRLNGEFDSYSFPIFYPRRLPEGTTFPEGSRVYWLRNTKKENRIAYRMVMAVSNQDGQHYFGVQGIRDWQDPPILEAPHEEIQMRGRRFTVYSEGDRVRLVAWSDRGNTYWVSNSLLLTLTNDQMLGMARSSRVFTAGS